MDVKREERILETILHGAVSSHDQSTAWYQFLKAKLTFPFLATYQAPDGVKPLCPGAKVQVIGLARPEECKNTMHVRVMDGQSSIRIPLTHLSVASEPAPNAEVLDDWRYWHARHHNREWCGDLQATLARERLLECPDIRYAEIFILTALRRRTIFTNQSNANATPQAAAAVTAIPAVNAPSLFVAAAFSAQSQ
jgi:hypothetical protein